MECDDDPVLAAERGAVPCSAATSPACWSTPGCSSCDRCRIASESAIVCCSGSPPAAPAASDGSRRLRPLQGGAQGGELLADVIMQLAGDAAALRFLGREQPAARPWICALLRRRNLAGAALLLALNLGFERTLLPLEAVDAPGVDARRAPDHQRQRQPAAPPGRPPRGVTTSAMARLVSFHTRSVLAAVTRKTYLPGSRLV